MGSFQKQSGGRQVFFEGQEEFAGQAIADIAREVLGGGPSFGAQQTANRNKQDIIRESARSGFSEKDPITQRRLQIGQQQTVNAQAANRNQLLNFLFSSAGSGGGGGFGIGLSKKN